MNVLQKIMKLRIKWAVTRVPMCLKLWKNWIQFIYFLNYQLNSLIPAIFFRNDVYVLIVDVFSQNQFLHFINVCIFNITYIYNAIIYSIWQSFIREMNRQKIINENRNRPITAGSSVWTVLQSRARREDPSDSRILTLDSTTIA